MSAGQNLPLWVQDREEVLKSDDGVEWRYGERPDYSRINEFQEKERKFNHAEASLNAIAHNLVKTFEMEASFKTNPQQWLSVVEGKFRMSTNGGPEYTARDIVDEGTYNLFLGDSEQYSASDEDFESSYNLFHTAFPNGFHWELIEVVAGPPKVVFKWRHWGSFKGAFKNHQPTEETIEIVGLSIAKVTEDLKIESVEHFFDTHEFLTKLNSGRNT
ncbi:MAG: ester cyclase [Oscillatoria sp. SIO1A7]|nr:ester cyclase [Oscillatoria sp. SIO1A7]